MTLISETSPCVRLVVRPYFCTSRPTNAVAVAELGVPYPSSEGVELPSWAVEERAIAASIVLLPPEKSMG